MTTLQRVWYEGAAVHITVRDNHRNDIFRDDEDFQYYVTVIEEALVWIDGYLVKIEIDRIYE